MKYPYVLVSLYYCFVSGTGATDRCWVYDYKYDWSSTPYKRLFTCPCGCCGNAWERWCCSSQPVCHHNSSIPPGDNYEDGEEQSDDGTGQALMLSGIIIGTFCVLLALTALTHMCGRVCLKFEKEQTTPPNVVVYNLQETPGQQEMKTVGPSTSGQEKISVDRPPSYLSVTTTV